MKQVHAGALSSPPPSLGKQSKAKHHIPHYIDTSLPIDCSALPSVLVFALARALAFAPVPFAPLFLAVALALAVAVAVLPSCSCARWTGPCS